MLQKFNNHINNQFSFLKGKKLLLAVSGGIDSIVLTHLFKSLDYTISLAHCNFNLRELESDKDEEFVKNCGEKLNLKTFTIRFNTTEYASENKISTQIAARDLRYQWFQELIIKHQFDYVLTAHHADDNLETFLINLSRGTGLEGLTGIPAINKNIIRPLLIFSREEIEQFAKENSIKWREDQSNATTKYVRNKIRHQIIPVLKEINPAIINSFQKTTDNLSGSQQIVKSAIIQFKEKSFKIENDVIKILISDVLKLSNPKIYLFELFKEFGFTEWNDIENLLSSQSGKFVYSKTHRLLKDREHLYLTKIDKSNSFTKVLIQEDATEITSPLKLSLTKTTKIGSSNLQTIYVDVDKITFPLTLRKWENGDVFYPKGMQGKKKLSKYFKDEKYSLIDKENTWILTSENKIIWLLEKRQDKRFSPTSLSKSYLKISITH